MATASVLGAVLVVVAAAALPSWVTVRVASELVQMAFYFLVNVELPVAQLIGYDEM